jgi:hypothetical protein
MPTHSDRHTRGSIGKTFVVVSGLPRSGTSLMMQLLSAAGLRIIIDDKRVADIDNPRGYYEWDLIKQIGRRPGLLDEIDDGAAFKCVSPLLSLLPLQHRYKILWMERPIFEVLASQQKMIEHRRAYRSKLSNAELSRALQAHKDEVLRRLATADNVDVLKIDYPELVTRPRENQEKLALFLAAPALADSKVMGRIADLSLYRNRT